MDMTTFEQIVKDQVEMCSKVMLAKSEEYSRNQDKLWNFKIAGRKLGVSQMQANRGMTIKHTVSIEDLITDIEEGKTVSMEVLDEKFTDEINYLLLLKAQMIEEISDKILADEAVVKLLDRAVRQTKELEEAEEKARQDQEKQAEYDRLSKIPPKKAAHRKKGK